MEETKKEKKGISGIVVFLIVLIAIVISAPLGYILGNKYLSSNENTNNIVNTNVNEKTDNTENATNNTIDSEVPIEDLYALDIKFNVINDTINTESKLYLVNNGNLYVKNINGEETLDYSSLWKYTLSDDNFKDAQDNIHKDLEKIDGLSNIKRIKGVALGSGESFDLLIITTDGKLYTYEENSKTFEEDTHLNDYQIDNITLYNPYPGCTHDPSDNTSVTCGGKYKFTTLDGTEYDVTENTDGTFTNN